MAGSSSFYNTTNAPVEGIPALSQELTDATAALNANNAAYTVVTNGYASTVTIDWSTANTQRLTLGGNCTLVFTGGRDGEKLVLELTQDSTGGRTVTWPAKVRFGASIAAIVLSSGSSKTDKIGFIYNQAVDKYDVVAVAYGY